MMQIFIIYKVGIYKRGKKKDTVAVVKKGSTIMFRLVTFEASRSACEAKAKSKSPQMIYNLLNHAANRLNQKDKSGRMISCCELKYPAASWLGAV